MASSLLSVQHHHQKHPPRPRAGAMTAAVTSPSRVVVASSSSSSVSFAPSSFALPSSAFSAPSASAAAPSASSSSSSSSSSPVPPQLSPSILKTFDAQTDVLITGGIGFVGSVVVEQLLRQTDVNKIFLLIRSKKVKGGDGKETRLAAQQRLDAFVDSSPLFDSLRVEVGGGEVALKVRPPRGVFEFGAGRG